MEDNPMSLFIVALTIATVMSLVVLLDEPIKRFLEKE